MDFRYCLAWTVAASIAAGVVWVCGSWAPLGVFGFTLFLGLGCHRALTIMFYAQIDRMEHEFVRGMKSAQKETAR